MATVLSINNNIIPFVCVTDAAKPFEMRTPEENPGKYLMTITGNETIFTGVGKPFFK